MLNYIAWHLKEKNPEKTIDELKDYLQENNTYVELCNKVH